MLQSVKIYLLPCLLLLSLIACSRQEQQQAQGYVEGRYTYIATPVGGKLNHLAIERGQMIKKDQLLFTLDEQPEIDQYMNALENLKQAIASKDVITPNLDFARLTYHRYQDLVAKKAIEQSALDQSQANYQAYIAQLAQAEGLIAANKAMVLQAEWSKNQKQVVAPLDAIVFDTYYRLGEYIAANQPVLSLLAPPDIKVIFFVSDIYLHNLSLGKEVKLACEGCENHLKGKISFISPTAEYTPPVIYSNETNNKLIFRVEAQLDRAQAIKLHPGQPIAVFFNI